ncbi:MAG: ABC transporter permease, partial [Betaproteobacteria bacterium]|nr:ABC transporter permease [Betaproteobacteria bacterium]
SPLHFLGLGLALNAGVGWGLHRWLNSPAGWALQASQQSSARALALGIPVVGLRWAAFVVAGGLAGASGALFVFAKGSVSPQVLGVSQSIDGLLMVMLGGWQHSLGAVLGAFAWVGLHDALLRSVTHWRAAMGGLLLVLVMALPHGLAGLIRLSLLRPPRPGGVT